MIRSVEALNTKRSSYHNVIMLLNSLLFTTLLITLATAEGGMWCNRGTPGDGSCERAGYWTFCVSVVASRSTSRADCPSASGRRRDPSTSITRMSSKVRRMQMGDGGAAMVARFGALIRWLSC